MVSSDGRNTSEIRGGRVVVVSSCEEGAGAASAVGQASAVHGACASGGGASGAPPVRSACRGPRPTTGRVATRSTDAVSWSGSCLRSNGSPCARSARGSCPRTSGSRSPTCATPGLSVREIARRLGRAPSTISRELRRNATSGRRLPPVRRPPPRDRTTSPPSPSTPRHQPSAAARWSPSCWRSGGARSRSAATCAEAFPSEPAMWLCHESIYQAVYQPGSPLLRPSPLAPHRRSPLRTGRDHRRAQQRAERRRPRFEQPMLHHPRPSVPTRGPSRSRPLGGRSDHRQGPRLSDRHARRTTDPAGPAAAPATTRRRQRSTTR